MLTPGLIALSNKQLKSICLPHISKHTSEIPCRHPRHVVFNYSNCQTGDTLFPTFLCVWQTEVRGQTVFFWLNLPYISTLLINKFWEYLHLIGSNAFSTFPTKHMQNLDRNKKWEKVDAGRGSSKHVHIKLPTVIVFTIGQVSFLCLYMFNINL